MMSPSNTEQADQAWTKSPEVRKEEWDYLQREKKNTASSLLPVPFPLALGSATGQSVPFLSRPQLYLPHHLQMRARCCLNVANSMTLYPTLPEQADSNSAAKFATLLLDQYDQLSSSWMGEPLQCNLLQHS